MSKLKYALQWRALYRPGFEEWARQWSVASLYESIQTLQRDIDLNQLKIEVCWREIERREEKTRASEG